MSNSNKVKVQFDKCSGMSDQAVLLDIDGLGYWIPYSQIHESSGLLYGESDVWIVIPEWLAEKKDLMDYAEEYDV